MRFIRSDLIRCLLPVLAVLVFSRIATAQPAPPGGNRIQFSQPSSTVSSNLNRLEPRQSTFKQVQDDLFKPFKLRNPEDDFDKQTPFPVPQQVAPQMPDKRTLDLIERRKNWAFANWNDLFPDSTMDQSSSDKLDDMGKKNSSLIEKYYESLGQKQPSETNRLKAIDRYSNDIADTNTFNPETFTPEGQIDKIMRHIFNPRSADGTDNSVIDFQHTAYHAPTAEEMQAQKRQIEEFQRLLDPHQVMTPSGQPGFNSQAQIPGAITNQFDFTSPHRNPINPSLVVTDPTARAFYSHVYDDPTALALGQTNNLLTPQPQPPQSLSVPPVPDSFPKRKF